MERGTGGGRTLSLADNQAEGSEESQGPETTWAAGGLAKHTLLMGGVQGAAAGGDGSWCGWRVPIGEALSCPFASMLPPSSVPCNMESA